MNISSLLTTLKTAFKDRVFLAISIAMAVIAVIVSVYVIGNLHPSELQVVTHYTAYGSTNFYRDKWYYLVVFAIFPILTAVLYTAIASKLFVQKGRMYAFSLLWMGIFVVIFMAAAAFQVLKLAALS